MKALAEVTLQVGLGLLMVSHVMMMEPAVEVVKAGEKVGCLQSDLLATAAKVVQHPVAMMVELPLAEIKVRNLAS